MIRLIVLRLIRAVDVHITFGCGRSRAFLCPSVFSLSCRLTEAAAEYKEAPLATRMPVRTTCLLHVKVSQPDPLHRGGSERLVVAISEVFASAVELERARSQSCSVGVHRLDESFGYEVPSNEFIPLTAMSKSSFAAHLFIYWLRNFRHFHCPN